MLLVLFALVFFNDLVLNRLIDDLFRVDLGVRVIYDEIWKVCDANVDTIQMRC